MQIDHVHFYVDNAQRWRDWFVSYLGFEKVVNRIFPSLNVANKSCHTITEVVKSGSIYFLLSSPLLATSPVAEFLSHHPPGVADIAFGVDNVGEMIAKVERHGVKVVRPIQDAPGFRYAQIAAWGSLTHTLIERRVINTPNSSRGNYLFTGLDHLVLNVEAGDLQGAVSWYENVLDFQPQQTFKIQTDISGLHSQVMIAANGSVQLPINEPTSGNSQIQEFLEANRGPGIQHIALGTSNIIDAIARLRAANLSFLQVPQTYYSQLLQRPQLPLSLSELAAIAQQQILVDWQDNGPLDAVLLQIFTKPIFPQPTFFFEFIERRSQAQGFGEGNFRALFAAIEQEQIKRGFISGYRD
ncbi:4-hydroxyphenylpyruvate dioxygenase [Richelia sinica FACHB-800]|uniref:4-hydroxyphenylpyruvate dioxygenase n=1 Tax=Richelia sinica FACHB-800 TaxID=1357546 RepID=A0A975T454_9NOST|nr:4-hydroxyphenylpyruvate dioxygenase [Richelia sinica]MBD2665840.1 4-hydroxyphenylpyruvate dioxygenase [Richelia sinica FACHB-800]QXE21605.1 4-hydroxyphenylpyruvate dioxygenase [Richelia sinica FACHB-800]